MSDGPHAKSITESLSPEEIARQVEKLGVAKARAGVVRTLALAVMAGRMVTDKLLGIVLPVTTFIAAGLEHSIANMCFVPLGLLLSTEPEAVAAAGLTADQLDRLTIP